MKKKWYVMFICMMLTMSFVACGNNSTNTNGESSVKESEEQGFVYVPTYYDWGVKIGENDWVNTYGIENGNMLGIYQSYDPDTYKSFQELWCMKLSDDTMTRIPLNLENENQYVNQFTLNSDGNVVACVEEYIFDESTKTGKSYYQLFTIDSTGQIIAKADLSSICEELAEKYEYVYIQNLKTDKDGMYYVAVESEVIVLNPEGTKAFSVPMDTWISSMGNMPDGSVYVMYYSGENYELAVIDKEAQAFGTKYTASGNMNGYYEISEGNIIYYSDGSSVRKFALETGESEKIFNWLDSDINGQYVESVSQVDADTFVAFYRNWNRDEEGFVKLVKTDKSLVAEKEIITMAAFSSSSLDLNEAIVDFNRKNDKYRIELKTYIDYNSMTSADYENYEQFINDATTRMMNDITGSNAPDLISISVGDGIVDLNTLAGKGILEEITPYLEQAGYSEDSFMEGVVNSYKIEDKLYTLPAAFSLTTQIADSEIVGTEPGWTLEEAMEILNNLPDGMQFQDYATQKSFVSQTLTYGYNNFVDVVNATCNFDSPEFKAILQMAKTFPKEYTNNEDWVSEPVRMQAGELLLCNVSIHSLENIQEYMAYLGGKDVTFIGMPGVNGNGSLISAYDGLYAICSKSDNKEAAAQFIIEELTKEYNKNEHTWGLPSYIPTMEAYIADEIDVEYLKDEKGELVLDEDGNPIPVGGTHGIGYGDWEYTFRPCNQEDVDILMKLVNGACSTYQYQSNLFQIILEELEPFFADQKSVDEVTAIIQNRISLYLIENS